MERDREPREESSGANWLLLAIAIAFIGAAYWLLDAMFAQKQRDDCIARGGRNCAPPIESPARRP